MLNARSPKDLKDVPGPSTMAHSNDPNVLPPSSQIESNQGMADDPEPSPAQLTEPGTSPPLGQEPTEFPYRLNPSQPQGLLDLNLPPEQSPDAELPHFIDPQDHLYPFKSSSSHWHSSTGLQVDPSIPENVDPPSPGALHLADSFLNSGPSSPDNAHSPVASPGPVTDYNPPPATPDEPGPSTRRPIKPPLNVESFSDVEAFAKLLRSVFKPRMSESGAVEDAAKEVAENRWH